MEHRGRGYREVALVINPILQCKPLHRFASSTVQYDIIKVATTTLSLLYLSLKARKEEKQETFSKINHLYGRRAIIMGDRKTRNLPWDFKSNPSGNRLKRWAQEKGWNKEAPKTPSFSMAKGASNPDIYLTRRVEILEPITKRKVDNNGSDHRLATTTLWLAVDEQQVPKRGNIPSRRRSNRKILQEVKLLYHTQLNVFLEVTKKAGNVSVLKNAYSIFKKIILSPWDSPDVRSQQSSNPFTIAF